MHKIKLKQFYGLADVHGTEREVVYTEATSDEPSMLVVKGLPIDDALHVLEHLRGGLLKDKDAEQPDVGDKAPPAQAVELETKEAETPAGSAGSSSIDVAAMRKMTTLREVIEHMWQHGINTPELVVQESRRLKDDVPVLKEAEQKGNFERRMDRAAITVLADRIGKLPSEAETLH